MIGNIERKVRAGRNLRTMRILLAAAAFFLIPFASLRKLSALVFEGRMLIEYHADRPHAAESLFIRYARKKQLTFWAISTFTARVVEPGHARRIAEILSDPRLSPGAAVLLRAASQRQQQGESGHAETGDSDQFRYHERLAQDGLAFMRAEPNYLDLTLALSTALSAEACDREDIFAGAIRHLIAQLERIEKDKALSREHMGDVMTARLSLFDLDGAQHFLSSPNLHGSGKAQKLAAEFQSILDETAGFRHVILRANEDILARAAGEQPVLDERPVILLPAAAFRKNRIDYPGFRSDIRFALSGIVAALDKHKISYAVRSRLRTHGVLNLPTPFFAYHTVSETDFGLHFKETDRPSLFSFDRRGYAGWSRFSAMTLAELHAADISPQAAADFFDREKQRVIGGNLSKYRQADISNVEELPEKFIFVGLQLIGDAVSQLAYLNLFEMVDEVVSTAKSHGLPVVVKRHPLCTTPEVSHYLGDLVSRGVVQQVHSSIHAIIPKAQAVCVINSGVGAEALLHEKPVYVFGRSDYMAGCFVCKGHGDFAEQFVAGKSRLSAEELRTFWYLLRNSYAVELRDRDRATAEIETRVIDHLKAFRKDGPMAGSGH